MSNPCLDAVVAELDKAGVPHKLEHGGKHLHVIYGENFEHTQIVPISPSDWRAPLNQRSDIRRRLRSFDLIAPEEIAPAEIKLTLAGGQATCTSSDIAESFGKAHKDVLRAIDNIRESCGSEFDQRNFAPIDYVDAKGRKYRAYRLTRDGFTLAAMGFTGSAAMDWKVKYIAAFNAMEKEIAAIGGEVTGYVTQADFDALLDLVASSSAAPAPLPKPGRNFIPASILARRAARKAQRYRRTDADRPTHW